MQANQYEQIANAIRALPDSDQKCELLRILVCNFLVLDKSFDSQQFMRRSFIDLDTNKRHVRPCV